VTLGGKVEGESRAIGRGKADKKIVKKGFLVIFSPKNGVSIKNGNIVLIRYKIECIRYKSKIITFEW
jgi:hypothetical protein